MNDDLIRAELNQILDPCSVVAGAPAGIEELGLVRSLSVRPIAGGLAVEVRIGVTEPGCMMGASFAVKARERLEALPSVIDVDVQVDHAADWDPADMAPGYAARLLRTRADRAVRHGQPRIERAAQGGDVSLDAARLAP